MEMKTFVERATVVWNPDGTIKGSEAHHHTGYFEDRDTPEGLVRVFVVVKHEVRPVLDGDFKALLPDGDAFLANAGRELADTRDNRRAHLAEMRLAFDGAKATIADQAASIAAQADALRETRAALQSEKAGREADAAAHKQALRDLAEKFRDATQKPKARAK
jgi:hypothetical protein